MAQSQRPVCTGITDLMQPETKMFHLVRFCFLTSSTRVSNPENFNLLCKHHYYYNFTILMFLMYMMPYISI